MKTRLTKDRLQTLALYTRFKAEREMIYFAERGEISAVDITKPETLKDVAWNEVFQMFGEERADWFSQAQVEKVQTYASQMSINNIKLFGMKEPRTARVINALRARKALICKRDLDRAFDADEFPIGDPRAYGPSA